MSNKFMIVAKCDSLNAKKYYHGERVLMYEGKTPVRWVHMDGLTYPECLAEFECWAEDGCTLYTDEWIEEDIKEAGISISLEEWMKDNPWYVGDGYYYNDSHELRYSLFDDVFCDDVMTYVIKEEDMELRENTEIYKEIYKKGDEVTPQERKIIESVGGTVKERKTEDYHAFAFDINQKDSVGADVGESLVELLNNLGNYNNEGCLWYLGDIDKEYVFLD